MGGCIWEEVARDGKEGDREKILLRFEDFSRVTWE